MEVPILKILDCDTLDSMYNSLELIIGISEEEVTELLDFDMEDFYKTNPRFYETGDALLLSKLKQKFKTNIQIDQTCWFHLTRTFEANDWHEGILPLQMMTSRIWESLFGLVGNGFSQKEWLAFQKDVESSFENHSAHLYRLKVANKLLWGPYAMLIKDIAFRAKEIGNHDYLMVPEIIEDICICFEERYGYNLLDKYIKSTCPCIVKFSSNGGKASYIGIVLNYLYNLYHGSEMSIYCNTCFDNNGELVKANNIHYIQFLT